MTRITSITTGGIGSSMESSSDPNTMEVSPYFDDYDDSKLSGKIIWSPNLMHTTVEPKIEEKKHVSDGGSSAYYELPEGTSELQDLIEYRNMNFAVGNIFKACYRLGAKSGIDDIYDMKKIIWYAQRELKRLEKRNG